MVKDELMMEKWAKHHNLKRSRGQPCIQRLLGKQCGGYMESCDCHPPAEDHVTVWNRDGKPYLYLSQPYGIHATDLVRTIEFCRKYGFSFHIATYPGFWNPGQVLSIAYFKGTIGEYKVCPEFVEHERR